MRTPPGQTAIRRPSCALKPSFPSCPIPRRVRWSEFLPKIAVERSFLKVQCTFFYHFCHFISFLCGSCTIGVKRILKENQRLKAEINRLNYENQQFREKGKQDDCHKQDEKIWILRRLLSQARGILGPLQYQMSAYLVVFAALKSKYRDLEMRQKTHCSCYPQRQISIRYTF